MTDIINALFFITGTVCYGLDITSLSKSKQVSGVSIWTRFFFLLWGLFNPYLFLTQGLIVSMICSFIFFLAQLYWFCLWGRLWIVAEKAKGKRGFIPGSYVFESDPWAWLPVYPVEDKHTCSITADDILSGKYVPINVSEPKKDVSVKDNPGVIKHQDEIRSTYRGYTNTEAPEMADKPQMVAKKEVVDNSSEYLNGIDMVAQLELRGEDATKFMQAWVKKMNNHALKDPKMSVMARKLPMFQDKETSYQQAMELTAI